MKYVRIFFALALIISQIPHIEAHAVGEDLFKKIKDTKQPVIVKGDKVEYSHDQKKIVGTGNVSITYGDIKLSCDKIIVYTDTKEAICEGNVKISQPGASMEGEKINYNFSEKRGYAINSKMQAPPFYGKAERVSQTGDKDFELDKGYVTTCNREKPHYRVEAQEVRVYLDDKVVAKNIVFYIFDIPVFFLPLYVQPLKGEFPEVTIVPGRTSDWGYYALTAWRYYFNENAKGHIHLDYREKKGLAAGIDYSFNLGDDLGKGIARFYYANENDALTINKSGPYDDRWRFQYRHSVDLPKNTNLTVELNKISDRDMIKDYFYREYEEDPIPDSYVLLQNTMPNYVLSLFAKMRLDDFYTVAERLPEVKLEINNQRLWNTNFYYTSEDSMVNFIKRYDDAEGLSAEEALRMDTYQKLSYAAKLFNFLYLTPYVATRQTYYSRNRWKVSNQLRSIYEAGFEASTKFYKVFDITTDFLGLDINRLRHIITPTAVFLNRQAPTISPSNLYDFDEIDEFEKHNGFEIGLENRLQTKRHAGDGMKVVDLATLLFRTDYNFRLEKKTFLPNGNGGFGDLYFKLELRPYEWMFVDGDMTLDHKTHDINSANIDFFLNPGKNFRLGIGHRYENSDGDKTSQLTGEIWYNFKDDWKFKIYERYDFASQKWEEQEYTITKDLHCWEVEASLDIRDGDYTTWIVFRLKAFPNVPIGLFETTYHRPRPGGQW